MEVWFEGLGTTDAGRVVVPNWRPVSPD
jgi:hypothetical protein